MLAFKMFLNNVARNLFARAHAKAIRHSGIRQFSKQDPLRSVASHGGKETVLIEDAPPKVKLGFAKVCAVIVPFVYIGAIISKNGAEFLEEWNIFVPEDDDD